MKNNYVNILLILLQIVFCAIQTIVRLQEIIFKVGYSYYDYWKSYCDRKMQMVDWSSYLWKSSILHIT